MGSGDDCSVATVTSHGGYPSPLLRPASTNKHRLLRASATAGDAGAGAPIPAADATVVAIVLASSPTLQHPVETFHPRKGRGEHMSNHSKHSVPLAGISSGKQSKERPRGGRTRAPRSPRPGPMRKLQPPLATRQHMGSAATSTGDAHRQAVSTRPGRPRTFFEKPLAAPRAPSCESPARPPVFLHAGWLTLVAVPRVAEQAVNRYILVCKWGARGRSPSCSAAHLPCSHDVRHTEPIRSAHHNGPQQHMSRREGVWPGLAAQTRASCIY